MYFKYFNWPITAGLSAPNQIRWLRTFKVDERELELMLETSAFKFEILYGGQFTMISTKLINPFECFTSPPTQHYSFFRNLINWPLFDSSLCQIGQFIGKTVVQ